MSSKLSTFYKDKYRGYDTKVKTMEDFKKIPYLTREEIVNSPPKTRVFIPWKEIYNCFMSSGTVSGGKPLIMPANRIRQAYYTDHWIPKFKKLGVKKILLLTNPSYLNGRIVDNAAHPELPKIPIIYCEISNLALAARLIRELEIDGIEATPSALNFLLPYLLETFDLSKIRFISLGGEYTSEQKFKFFRSYFKNAYFEFRFGGAETRFVKAFRCEYLAKTAPPYIFHPFTQYYLFETADEELILTSLTKNAPFPLIRYKTGDHVKFYNRVCPCGEKEFIEVLGRIGYDSARIGGITIHVSMIDEALAKAISGFNGDWEAHLFEEIKNNRLMPKIVIKLSSVGKNRLKSTAKKIEENLRVSIRFALSDLVKREVFLPLEIQPVAGKAKTHKRIKIFSHIK